MRQSGRKISTQLQGQTVSHFHFWRNSTISIARSCSGRQREVRQTATRAKLDARQHAAPRTARWGDGRGRSSVDTALASRSVGAKRRLSWSAAGEARARHDARAEKIFKLAKGFRGRAKNTIRAARNRVEKALQYSYRDRKGEEARVPRAVDPADQRGDSEHGVKYSEFMHGLKEENVTVDRKILAELARTEPYSFKALVDQVKRMKGIV